MQATRPHFLLFTEANASADAVPRWRFVLQSIGGDQFLAADDAEPGTPEDRLELLAVVRGLEALDAPARVTLVTASRYVNRGIRRGMNQWRERKWRWERFGEFVPIRNQDLWQRIDRALEFHQLECGPIPETNVAASKSASSDSRHWRFDRPESNAGLRGPLHRTWNRLRQGVLAPLAAIWRPAFTRAA